MRLVWYFSFSPLLSGRVKEPFQPLFFVLQLKALWDACVQSPIKRFCANHPKICQRRNLPGDFFAAKRFLFFIDRDELGSDLNYLDGSHIDQALRFSLRRFDCTSYRHSGEQVRLFRMPTKPT